MSNDARDHDKPTRPVGVPTPFVHFGHFRFHRRPQPHRTDARGPYACRRVHSKPQTTHTRIKTAKVAAFRHTRLHNNRLASSFKRLPRPPHATRLCQRSLPHPVRRPGWLQRPVQALRRYDLLLKASYGSYLWVGGSMKMSDFGPAISCFSIREGTLGITAEVIWRSEAVVKPSYGAVKMLT